MGTIKRKFLWYVFLSVTILLVAGCGKKDQLMVQSPIPIAVSFKVTPAPLHAHQAANISVMVTQRNERVNNADEVKFEIWRKNQENHLLIPAKKTGGGVYSIVYTFEKTGPYFVMYHVTARNMHTMAKQTVTVE